MLNPIIILAQALRNINVNPSKYIKINDAGTGFMLVGIDDLINDINTKGSESLNATKIDGKTIQEFIDHLKTEFKVHEHQNLETLNKIDESSLQKWNDKQDALGFTPEDSSKKGIADGYASLDSTGKVPVIQLPAIAKESVVVQSIAERDALTNVYPGLQCMVIDIDAVAAGEQSVLYVCKEVTNAGLPNQQVTWVAAAKLGETQMVLEWANIQNKPTHTAGEIDDAVTKKHEHQNIEVLNKLSEDSEHHLQYDGKPIVVGTKAIGALKNINLKAPADSTTEFTVHGVEEFDKEKDKIIAVYYTGLLVDADAFTYDKTEGKINLVGWSLFENEVLNIEVEKGTQE